MSKEFEQYLRERAAKFPDVAINVFPGDLLELLDAARLSAPSQPAQGWRLLEVGEVIQEGDEIMSSNGIDWNPCVASVGKSCAGKYPIRRRLSQPALEFKPLELSEKDKEFIKTREDFESGIANGWREK
jgi:hypothetical protein